MAPLRRDLNKSTVFPMTRPLALLPEPSVHPTALLHHFVYSIVDYALYMLDTEGVVANWSLGAERMKGYRAEDIVGHHFAMFFTDEDRALGLPAMALASALRTGHHECDAVRVRRNGTRFLAHVVIDPIYDEIGRHLGFAKITRDITEEHALQQHTAEAAATTAERERSAERLMLEERCRRMVEAAPNAMVLVNKTGVIEMVNRQAELRFGYSRTEMLGHSVEMLVPDAVRPHHAALRGGFLTHAETRAMGKDAELHGRRKDGTVFPVEIGLNTIQTDDGLMVLAAVVDITERRQAEAMRHQQAVDLARSNADCAMLEERCRRIVEAAPSAMVLVNESGEIEMVNRMAELRFGYSRAEMVGFNVDMLVPDAVRPHHAALRAGFAANAVSRPMGKDAALHGRRRDGSIFPVEIGLNTIETDGGMMVLAAIVDITERRQAETTRQRQTQELARSNADLQEFAYITSHDLKAPLRAVSLLADWITEDVQGTASAETLANLDLMRQRVARMSMLLDGLQSYTRVGHLLAPAEAMNIRALLGDIIDSLAPPPGFSVRFEGEAPTLNSPRPPLEHVLQNLISNAIKHHDRPEGEVVVSARRLDGMIEFRVRDDGGGIPPEFHKRIFTIFQTLNTRDECEASGVGLSIVQKTVERVGGRVWIESEPPRRGTSFIFTWPEGSEC